MSGEVFAGGCACGKVRYEVRDGGGYVPYACHCTDCQTRQGSAFALQLVVPEDELKVTGEVIVGTVTKLNGQVVTNIGCRDCLTRLYTRNSARPGLVTLRAGTRDDSSSMVPALHLWTASKQPWIVLPPDVPAFAEQPADPAEWMRLIKP